MNAKHAKTLTKIVVSGAFSLLMGYTYKMSKKIDERIDDYYAEPQAEPDTNQDSNPAV